MTGTCNLFSIHDSELQVADDTLPRYDDHTSVLTTLRKVHTIQLGAVWHKLHVALGDHDGENLLGFLAAGGTVFGFLDDGPRSSGRYFGADEVFQLGLALDHISEAALPADLRSTFVRLRTFVREAISGARGIVVHHMR
ncbi:MAG: DUF1877 family protein [Kofleriaceae bacterium]